MDKELNGYFKLFIENYNSMRKNSKNKYSQWYPISSNIYTSKKIIVNPDRIRKCQSILKENQGFFSVFRGISFFPLATCVSSEKNPREFLEKVLNCYDILNIEFPRSNYLPLISYMLVNKEVSNINEIVIRSKDIYEGMKKDFPLKIKPENYLYSFLLALKSDSVYDEIKKVRKIYMHIIDFLPANKNLMKLCQLVSLFPDEEHQNIIEKIIIINKLLKEKNLKISQGENLIALGILASLKIEPDLIINDVQMVYRELSKQRGFRPLKMSKSNRIMYSSIIIANKYAEGENILLYNIIIANNLIAYLISNQSD